MRQYLAKMLGGAIAMGAVIAAVLACNAAGAERVDTRATIQAVYGTITAQALAAGQPGAEATAPPLTESVATSAAVTLSSTTPVERVGNGSNLSIPRCPTGLVVDANEADWSSLSSMPRIELEANTYGGARWEGAEDTSGYARICWTDAALFVLIFVTDDLHVQTESGATQFQGDEVELVFDGDLPGDFSAGVWDGDDRQLGLSPGDFNGLEPAAVIYHPSMRSADEVTLFATKLPDSAGGYLLEASIPWSTLGITPQADTGYGLCLAISDNDQAGAASQDSMISHCTRLLIANPTTWVTVRLAR
jgi:hypothetical protein